MAHLDCRSLTNADSFGQVFNTIGVVRYTILNPVEAIIGTDTMAFSITVKDRKDENPIQHNVDVGFNGKYTATPASVEIQQGDLVLWHASDPDIPPYAIQGTAEDGRSFSSKKVQSGGFYAHTFQNLGKYEWLDSAGSNAQGSIQVNGVDPDDDKVAEKWTETVKSGPVLSIQNGTPDSSDVEITVGQTVFFTVIDSEGLTVIDKNRQR